MTSSPLLECAQDQAPIFFSINARKVEQARRAIVWPTGVGIKYFGKRPMVGGMVLRLPSGRGLRHYNLRV